MFYRLFSGILNRAFKFIVVLRDPRALVPRADTFLLFSPRYTNEICSSDSIRPFEDGLA